MLVKYYYLRDKYNAPRLTRCVVKNEEGEVAVGSALCSYSDFPNKKVGRRIAFHRAMYALKKKEDVLPIKRTHAQEVLIEVCADDLDYAGLQFTPKWERDFKGIYVSADGYKFLNKFERQLVEKFVEKEIS
jgi:hypothetical protein